MTDSSFAHGSSHRADACAGLVCKSTWENRSSGHMGTPLPALNVCGGLHAHTSAAKSIKTTLGLAHDRCVRKSPGCCPSFGQGTFIEIPHTNQTHGFPASFHDQTQLRAPAFSTSYPRDSNYITSGGCGAASAFQARAATCH